MITKSPSSFIGNVVKLATGSTLAQGVGIIAAPIVARLFMPAAFGSAALFGSIVGIVGVVACLRYEFAIMLPEDDQEAANLFVVSILFVLLVALLSGLVVMVGGGWLVSVLNMREIKGYLWLVPIAVIANGVFLVLNYWGSRVKRFGRLSVAQMISSGTTQATKLGAGFAGFATGGVLIVAGVIGQAVSAFLLTIQAWRKDGHVFIEGVRWNRMIAAIKRYNKFPKFDIWSGLLNAASWQLPTLLLAVFFTPAVVGYYALGLAVVRLPMNIIGKSVARVFYQRASEAKSQGQVGGVVENVYVRLVAIGLFPVLILCVVGRDLFLVAFGENWPEAGVYIQILAPFVFFNFISSPMSTLFSVYERQECSLYLNAVIFMTRLLSLYIGAFYGNVYVALGLFSLTGVVVYGGLSAWSMKMVGLPMMKFVSPLIKYFLVFLPVALGLLLLKLMYNLSPVVYVLLAAFIVTLYELIVFLRDGSMKSYFTNMARRKTAGQEGLA